jgi:hypothetical protein
MDCEQRLLHGPRNILVSAKTRPNTLWMFYPIRPWTLQPNWALDPRRVMPRRSATCGFDDAKEQQLWGLINPLVIKSAGYRL